MIGTSTTTTHSSRDRLRQILNLVFALAQIVITIVGYINSTNASFDGSNAQTSPVVPADYTFAIWGVIYLGALAYALYQALPQHREDVLLRRIGFYTASAYLATSVWLIVAQQQILWLTVVCIFWILLSLLGAFFQFLNYRAPFSRAEPFLVVLPTSIYTAWATIASIANPASVLQSSGFSNVIFPDETWAIVMLIVGGLIAAFVTLRSRGDIGYALTFIWAMIGVVVANIVRNSNTPVALTASSIAVLVGFALLYAQIRIRSFITKAKV